MKTRKSVNTVAGTLLLVALLGCAACSGSAQTDVQPTVTESATATAVPTETAEATPIATTPTVAPTPTVTPAPTPSSSEDAHAASKVLDLSFEGNVKDNSQAGNDGTLNKEGVYVEGVSGQALSFDGSTYIDLGTSTALQPAQLTFSAWIKSEGTLTGEHMIAWFKPSGNYQGDGWYLSCLDDSTPLKLSVGPSASQPMELFVSGSRADFFPANEWVHIAVTYDSTTQTAAFYRNGIAQTVSVINTASEITTDANSHKYIGFNSPGYNGGFVKLSMDELSIYNEALSASDIIDLYTKYGAEFDGKKVVDSDYDSLTLSILSIESDLTLPTAGASGSNIVWTSSDESVLTATGKLSRPASGSSDAKVTLTATLSYAGYTRAKTFHVTVEALPSFGNLSDVSMSTVTLLNDYEENAFALETEYLKLLDADRLLRGFCDIAGIESSASLYGGWENTAIKGHTLGHYLSALSYAYATSGDEELLATINHVVDVLAQCQNSETGYLAAIPESHYLQIEQGNTSGTWVPWYIMHKVLAGLLDAYEFAGNDKALSVASKLGDWVYSRTSSWDTATQARVLNVEYGGMNDCLYQLYSFTKAEQHLSAAHSFDEMSLFNSLYNGKDVLNGKHANTTIPKIIGALNRYIVLGESEEYYLQVAENFWEIVVNNHTYVTGGNSEWERFGQSNILDAERTNCNCETCNTYNMLKLSRELFKITGKKKYADYYENTFINAILSSQNPETGMTTYFQPMATGYFKVYSSAINHFWCCTGSGMESFSKLNDSIYYKDDAGVYVVRYTSSELTWEEKNLILTQDSNVPADDTVSFTVSTISGDTATVDIVLRVPDWCAAEPVIKINGTVTDYSVANGFIRLSNTWKNGDRIEYTIPAKVTAYRLPDNENAIAFKYGPLVLSADLGNRNMKTGTTGASVTIPTLEFAINDVIFVTDGTIDQWLENVNDNLVRTEGTLEFTLKNTDQNLVFTPHYLQYQNRYGIYFRFSDYNTAETAGENNEYLVVDSLPVANDQYEFSHNMVANASSTGTLDGLNYRDAAPGGYFRYDLSVDNSVTNYLSVKYYGGDAGRTFSILVNGNPLATVTITDENGKGFYDVLYELPTSITNNQDTITITFKAGESSYAGGIFEKISILKDMP